MNVTTWDGSPRVNEDGNLEVMTQDERGYRYGAVIFKGMIAGYRAGNSDPDEFPTHIVLFAGGEVHVEVKDYKRDLETILNWVKGAK